MKKLLLALGTVAAIATPVATVVACDANPEIHIKFPTVKGDYEVNITATIGDTTDGLKNLFKEIQKQEMEQTPQAFNAIQSEAINLPEKFLDGSFYNIDDAMSEPEKLLQKAMSLTWEYGIVTQTLNLDFTSPNTLIKINGTTHFVADATEGIENIEGIKNITKDNINIITNKVFAADRENTTQLYWKMLKALKENPAVEAWAKSFPSYMSGSEIDWNKCVLLEFDGRTVTLGSSWDKACDIFSEYIRSITGNPTTY